jgi:hypothetical protein
MAGPPRGSSRRSPLQSHHRGFGGGGDCPAGQRICSPRARRAGLGRRPWRGHRRLPQPEPGGGAVCRALVDPGGGGSGVDAHRLRAREPRARRTRSPLRALHGVREDEVRRVPQVDTAASPSPRQPQLLGERARAGRRANRTDPLGHPIGELGNEVGACLSRRAVDECEVWSVRKRGQCSGQLEAVSSDARVLIEWVANVQRHPKASCTNTCTSWARLPSHAGGWPVLSPRGA